MGDNEGFDNVEMTGFKNPPPSESAAQPPEGHNERKKSVVHDTPPKENMVRKKSVAYGRRTSIIYSRGVSMEASSGKKLVKNIQRVEDNHTPTDNKVPLFRLNSIAKDVGTKEEGEEPERQQWDNPVEFLLSCISMSVGLGNVWRFPFTAYENGGGAFLIPYILVLLFVGRPLYLLELALGQFSSSGSVRVWDMVPAFGGVGYGQVIATGCVTTYYCSLIGLSIYYLGMSFYPTLPWTECSADLGLKEQICIPSSNKTSDFVTCYNQTVLNSLSNQTEFNSTVCVSNEMEIENITEATKNISVISSAEQFFKFGVLKEKEDISDGLGLPDPPLAGCLAVCWLLIYVSLRKGVSSSGKVAYFTAIFPYVVMIIMLIRGLTLPGAVKGLKFFFTPQWDKLASLKVWYAAVTQSFFSLSVGFGTLTTYASYNKFRHNTNRDALIISFADTGTSLLAGTVIFSILGHLSEELGVEVKDVVKSGGGLAFVSYPEVLAKFTFAPQLFAVLFFLMLITLGFGSAIGLFSAVTTTICDSFPNTNRKSIIKVCCVFGFALGLFYVTPGGQTMLDLVDYYGGTMLIIALASLEVIAINWIYGTNVLTRDFNYMLNTELSVYWRFCWGVICPLLLPLLFFYAMITQSGMPELSATGQFFGWLIAVIGILVVPFHFLLSITADEEGNFLPRLVAVIKGGLLKQKISEIFRPNSAWGPTSIKERKGWQEYQESVGIYDWLPQFIRSKLGSKEEATKTLP